MRRNRRVPRVGGIPEGAEYALSPHHRAVLACLRSSGGETTAAQLARDVTAQRRNQPPAAVPPAAIRETYSDLIEQDLQKLAHQGLVEVCEQTGTVRLLV